MAVPRTFHDVVRERHSVRSFLPTPVSPEVLRQVLEDAQLSPSNCNTQPWQVHIVSGAKRDELSKAILEDDASGKYTLDFTFDEKGFEGVYADRRRLQGAAYHQALGISREAREERQAAARYNLNFFGAPHVALFFMPSIGDNVRVASDIGMYAQTFLLALTAKGLAGVPQTYLGFFAERIRALLGIDSSSKLLFGVSFGYPNTDSAANAYRIGRVPLEDSVTFHS